MHKYFFLQVDPPKKYKYYLAVIPWIINRANIYHILQDVYQSIFLMQRLCMSKTM